MVIAQFVFECLICRHQLYHFMSQILILLNLSKSNQTGEAEFLSYLDLAKQHMESLLKGSLCP